MTQIPDYIEIYEGDRYCLMCRHTCPVERVTKRESTSPHGWALLIASERRGQVAWGPETVDTLFQCADCGLCQANCVSVRPLPAAIVAARAGVTRQGLALPRVYEVEERLRAMGHPYGDGFSDPFANSAKGRADIGLFVGAATTARRPQAVAAASKLLDKADAGYTLLSTGRSGVYLPYTLGLWDTARRMADETLKEIRDAGVKQVVTLSREDAHTFAHVYQEIGIAFPEDVQVIEFVDWLDQAIERGSLQPQVADLRGYVYHDPAHTPRMMDKVETTRRLILRVAGNAPGEMLWRQRVAAPAGSVGGFEWTQPALAELLTRERLEHARLAGAKGIITEDPQCTAQLALYADGLPVVNLIELLAETADRGAEHKT